MINAAKKIWITSLGIAFLILVSCQTLSFKNEERLRGDETYYLINTDTDLDEIVSGNPDMFSQQIVTPQPPLSQNLSKVQWTQKDYLSIAETLHKFVWNESIAAWNLRYAYFAMNCEDVGKGPQFTHFIFYKVIEENQQKTRFEHRIYVDPSNNSVSWAEDEYWPSLVTQHPIELSKLAVSISEALQIADDNGGQVARTKEGNNCKISGELTNSSDNWKVRYTNTLDLFEIDINAFNGKYKILHVE